MDEKSAQLWTKLSAALKPQVSADTFKRWFSAVKLTGATANEVTLLVPNNIYQFWIESNHMPALQAAIEFGPQRSAHGKVCLRRRYLRRFGRGRPGAGDIGPGAGGRGALEQDAGAESAQHLRIVRGRA